MPEKRKFTADHLALNRLLAVEECGTEHFERELTHDEKALSLFRRIDFGQTVEADTEKENQPVKEWPWQGLCENLVEAEGELRIVMDLIDNVQANIDVDVAILHRPKRLPSEELSDRAISLSVKLLTFNRLSKYIKQSVRSLSQKISREATFYGALMRLQRNWKVRQRKDRTVGSGENSGFVVLLSNDVLRDLRLPFHLLSLCMVHLNQDASGMLTANLPKHSRRSFHVVFNQGKSGRLQWEYIRKKTSSIAPFSNSVDNSQIGDQETGRAFSNGIGEGVDEGSKRAHSVFREILSEIFDLQVFGFVMSEIDGVNPTGISENLLQLKLSPEITLTLCLEPSPSDQDEQKKNGESVPKHSQKSVDSDFDTTDGDSRNQMEGNTQEKSVANQEDQKDNKESSPMHNQKSVESDVDMTNMDLGHQIDGGDSEHLMEGVANQEDQKDNHESSPMHNQKSVESDVDMTNVDLGHQMDGGDSGHQMEGVANQEDQNDNKESSPMHNQKSVESDVDMTNVDLGHQMDGGDSGHQMEGVANQEDQKDNKESSTMHNQKSVESDVDTTNVDLGHQMDGGDSGHQMEGVANQEDQKGNKESSPMHNQKSVESDVNMTNVDLGHWMDGGDSGHQMEGVDNQEEDRKDDKESSPMHNQKSVESDVNMTNVDLGHRMDGGDSGHQIEGEAGDKKEDTCRFSRRKKKHPAPLSSEVYLQQIVLQKIMGLYIRDKGLMTGKAGEATTGVAVGGGQEALPSNTINILSHFCLTLSHRIFSYKVLDELENMLHIQYLCLVSHPSWAPYTSAWFLYLDIPETVICRVQTKVSEWNGAQKNVRSRYYCKILVHKESLTIEGGPIPCIGGIFLGTSTEVRSISEYKCGLDDLTLFLLQQTLLGRFAFEDFWKMTLSTLPLPPASLPLLATLISRLSYNIYWHRNRVLAEFWHEFRDCLYNINCWDSHTVVRISGLEIEEQSYRNVQVASQILHWLHKEVTVYKEKVKRDFLGLSFEVDKSYTITLVANIDAREYDINWLLVVKDIVPEHVTTNLENTIKMVDDGVGTLIDTSNTRFESKLLGSLKLEDLYDIVLDLVSLVDNVDGD